MEHQTVLDAEARAKSFLQAKWFPGAIAVVSLVIAIGGHAFTGWNSVSVAKMKNQVNGLEVFKTTTQSSDSNQDRAIQILQTDDRNLLRAVQQMQVQIAELSKANAELRRERDTKTAQAETQPLDSVAQKPFSATESDSIPLPTSVNERFDSLIRSRMKPFWVVPVTQPGEQPVDNKTMVILQFRVDRQGAVTEVLIANPSGHSEFDIAAVNAALKMNSIPEVAGLNNRAYAHVQTFRLAVSPASML
jgi:TonB family protein